MPPLPPEAARRPAAVINGLPVPLSANGGDFWTFRLPCAVGALGPAALSAAFALFFGAPLTAFAVSLAAAAVSLYWAGPRLDRDKDLKAAQDPLVAAYKTAQYALGGLAFGAFLPTGLGYLLGRRLDELLPETREYSVWMPAPANKEPFQNNDLLDKVKAALDEPIKEQLEPR